MDPADPARWGRKLGFLTMIVRSFAIESANLTVVRIAQKAISHGYRLPRLSRPRITAAEYSVRAWEMKY
jgi:hypothetical protein